MAPTFVRKKYTPDKILATPMVNIVKYVCHYIYRRRRNCTKVTTALYGGHWHQNSFPFTTERFLWHRVDGRLIHIVGPFECENLVSVIIFCTHLLKVGITLNATKKLHVVTVGGWCRLSRNVKNGKQVAQLSQRDRAAGWVSYRQKWKTGTGRQYLWTL